MHDFLLAFLGGILLGLSVVGYLYVNGRIAGVSGLIEQVLPPPNSLHNACFMVFARTVCRAIFLWHGSNSQYCIGG